MKLAYGSGLAGRQCVSPAGQFGGAAHAGVYPAIATIVRPTPRASRTNWSIGPQRRTAGPAPLMEFQSRSTLTHRAPLSAIAWRVRCRTLASASHSVVLLAATPMRSRSAAGARGEALSVGTGGFTAHPARSAAPRASAGSKSLGRGNRIESAP